MNLMTETHDSMMRAAGETLRELTKSFGFYPENSLIIRWLKHNEVVLVQRCDIAAFLSPQGLAPADLEIFIEPGQAYGAEEAALVVCLEHLNIRVHAAIEIIELELVNANITMGDVFIAVGQRMYSRDCLGNCDSHVIPIDTGIKRVDRAFDCAINPAQLIQATDFPELPEPNELSVWREIESQFAQDLMKVADDSFQVSELARLAVALGDIRVRDSILWDMANGNYDRSAVAKKLTHGLPQLEATHGGPMATAAAICWWLTGNGAMANLCLDRAFQDAPEYSLAAMVRAALNHALPPEFWLESINELTRQQCLAGLGVDEGTTCGYDSV